MILGQIFADAAASMETWLTNESIAVAIIAFILLSASAWFWKVKVPQQKESHNEEMTLKKTWIDSVGQQTRTLKGIQDSLGEHSNACLEQYDRETEVQREFCARITQLSKTQDDHTEAAVMAVEHVRAVFRDFYPELGTKISIEDKCNDLVLVLRRHNEDS